jgi:hypothetical protein
VGKTVWLHGVFSSARRKVVECNRNFVGIVISLRSKTDHTNRILYKQQSRRDATTDGFAFVPQDRAVRPISLARHRHGCRAWKLGFPKAQPGRVTLVERLFCDAASSWAGTMISRPAHKMGLIVSRPWW